MVVFKVFSNLIVFLNLKNFNAFFKQCFLMFVCCNHLFLPVYSGTKSQVQVEMLMAALSQRRCHDTAWHASNSAPTLCTWHCVCNSVCVRVCVYLLYICNRIVTMNYFVICTFNFVANYFDGQFAVEMETECENITALKLKLKLTRTQHTIYWI